MTRTVLLDARQVPTADLERMVALMQEYYENVTPERFMADLRKKDHVIVVWQGEQVCGFSTVVVIDCTAGGGSVRVMFSGDTVMNESSRSSVALPLAVARFALDRLRGAPHIPLYWLLTSKGYKTFHSLPVFFHSFHPWPGRAISALEREVLVAAAAQLFPGRLDTQRWILTAGASDQRLRAGMAEITGALRTRPDVAYFEQTNPGYARGDELVCLARFEECNLRRSILRRLETYGDR
jgi:hypothetical protein